MSSNETPGVGGVPGFGRRVVRMPGAWQTFVKVQLETIPQATTRTHRARLRLDRLGKPPTRGRR